MYHAQLKTSPMEKLFVNINFLSKNEHSLGWALLCAISVVILIEVNFHFRPGKYDTETVEGQPAFYNIRMKLRIHNVSASDFGTYRCMAKNSQGETTGDIELYGNFLLEI